MRYRIADAKNEHGDWFAAAVVFDDGREVMVFRPGGRVSFRDNLGIPTLEQAVAGDVPGMYADGIRLRDEVLEGDIEELISRPTEFLRRHDPGRSID